MSSTNNVRLQWKIKGTTHIKTTRKVQGLESYSPQVILRKVSDPPEGFNEWKAKSNRLNQEDNDDFNISCAA
eukprot:1180034-Prorocentrum_minimum.AAC.4